MTAAPLHEVQQFQVAVPVNAEPHARVVAIKALEVDGDLLAEPAPSLERWRSAA